MAVLQPGQTYADFAHKFITVGCWGFMGDVVDRSIAKLEAEGFTNKEARYWLEALTILQLIRIGMPVPPGRHRFWVPDPIVYTEADIMAMIAAGVTIPATEYEGFEGFH